MMRPLLKHRTSLSLLSGKFFDGVAEEQAAVFAISRTEAPFLIYAESQVHKKAGKTHCISSLLVRVFTPAFCAMAASFLSSVTKVYWDLHASLR